MSEAELASLRLNKRRKSASGNIGSVRGTISVARGMTLDAAASLAPSSLAFLSALVLFQGDDEALRLWRALAYFGAAYAAFVPPVRETEFRRLRLAAILGPSARRKWPNSRR
jgi:hypothetical protein